LKPGELWLSGKVVKMRKINDIDRTRVCSPSRATSFFKISLYFSLIHTMTMHIKFLTTALNICIKTLKPYTLARFDTGIFCSVGGRDDHYAKPPGLLCKN
jgi:hypothetical protein